MELKSIALRRLTGEEAFRSTGNVEAFKVLDFWQWSSSDLVSNTTRGVLAEYLVGRALGCTLVVREEWAAYDLKTPEGYSIEVKSAAYLQSWAQKRQSTISFLCPKRRAWDAETGTWMGDPRRHSDAYVFALLAHCDKASLDPLDVSQWEFYAVPTAWLNERQRSQHSITLPSLRREFDCLSFQNLKAGVAAAVSKHREGASLVKALTTTDVSR